MGTFAALYKSGEAEIPENKRQEFTERIEKLFQAGGMMEIELVRLYGIEVRLIRKAQMKEDGMDFFYNYFEDDYWENAGFDKENCHVCSEKIGGKCFHRTVVAAYMLEELYTEGLAATIVSGSPVTAWGYIGWLNYLFHEHFHMKNFDSWKLFEAFHYSEEDRTLYYDEFSFGETRYSFISSCEVYSVLHGTEATIQHFSSIDEKSTEYLALEAMKNFKRDLNIYITGCDRESPVQMDTLMNMVRSYYETDDSIENSPDFNDNELKTLRTWLRLSDAPAFVIKAISEICNVDFWDLWEQIRDIVHRKFTTLYSNKDFFIAPISTMDFFHQSPDDMIPYWEEGNAIKFSDELKIWMDSLKDKFDILLESDLNINNWIEYLLTLMNEADEEYYHIYTFADFFEETLENLSDKRYQALWKLYDELIHDPELKAAGDVIFVPEGPEHENEGIHYWGTQPKRRLKTYWEFTSPEKKNNKGRMTLRRYMALVANRTLRYKVFGF